MFVVITYDVDKKRCSKVMNFMRRYCFHVQDSVFMGEVTEKQYKEIRKGLSKIVKEEVDRILLIRTPSLKAIKMDSIGQQMMIETII